MYTIRPITKDDAAAALAVYAPYVRDTAISFEYEVPTVGEFAQKIETLTAQYPWLVCECDGEIVGYTYGGVHRGRTAYQWSVETAIYLSPAHQGKGLARALYEALFVLLRLQGYCSVFAGTIVPNTSSEQFHVSMGFREIGVFKNIGYKHGKWHDTKWFQLDLNEHTGHPDLPMPFRKLLVNEYHSRILHNMTAKEASNIKIAILGG